MGFDGNEIKRRKEEIERRPKSITVEPSGYKQHQSFSSSIQEIKNIPIIEKLQRKPDLLIDCHACKMEGGMSPCSVPKFSQVMRLIGFIIAVPSAIGMAVSVIVCINVILQGGSLGLSGSSGGAAVGVVMGIVFFCISLVSGAIGWFLLGKKKVFKCVRCGFILDRA